MLHTASAYAELMNHPLHNSQFRIECNFLFDTNPIERILDDPAKRMEYQP